MRTARVPMSSIGNHTAAIARFRPIYTPMFCNTTEQNVGKEQIDENHGALVNATATTICTNANPYFTFRMKPIGDTKLYLVLGDDVSEVGNASVDPQVILPFADTLMPSNITMYFNSTQSRNMIDYHRTQGEPMMMSVTRVWGGVDLDLYGWKLRSPWHERYSWCAWSIDPRKRLNGPLVCEGSLSALRHVVKPANATFESFEVYVPSEELARAEQLRDWFCSIVMGSSSLLFVAVMLCSAVHVRAQSRRTFQADGGDMLKVEEGRLEEEDDHAAKCPYRPTQVADKPKEAATSVSSLTTRASTPRGSASTVDSASSDHVRQALAADAPSGLSV
eukprot:TRINITY_DN12279_c0_g1_i1.p1 TRINITY_DN12279_c0_g1~~TRINITY_DN12279_c0_g1_i1.p1  ORF type:complete len:334 (+),score=32.46 TRINITY_DN12279_c0_g1_i1:319-1320(+)